MDDEQLAAAVYIWRTKASLGDQDAADIADMLEARGGTEKADRTDAFDARRVVEPTRTSAEAANLVALLVTLSFESRAAA